MFYFKFVVASVLRIVTRPCLSKLENAYPHFSSTFPM